MAKNQPEKSAQQIKEEEADKQRAIEAAQRSVDKAHEHLKNAELALKVAKQEAR